MEKRGRSSDSGLPPTPPSRPVQRPVASRRGASPLTAAGPSRTCTGFPHRAPVSCDRPYHRTVPGTLRLWGPVAAWAAVIFAFSSVPDLGTGLGTWDLVLRKLAHAGEYALLGLLLQRATRRPSLALLLGVLYAISDELHQHFVEGRVGSVLDVGIDAVGLAIGVALWEQARRRLPA
jgi:VanZ family protein